MPVVTLSVSKTVSGANVNDTLSGGSTGVDLGTVANGAFSNTTNLFVKHDGAQKITGLSYYIQSFTGTYGGNYTASADYAKLLALGDAGTPAGLQVDEVWNSSPNFQTFYQVKTGNADSFANRRVVPTTAMSRNNSGTEVGATTPVAGEVGPTGNTVIGDRAHVRERISIPSAEVDGGIRQFDAVFAYNYTT